MEPENIRLDYKDLSKLIEGFMGCRTNRIIPKYGYVEQQIIQNDMKEERLQYIKKDGDWKAVIKRESPDELDRRKLDP